MSSFMADERRGLVTAHLVSEARNASKASEEKLAEDAISSHLQNLEAGSDASVQRQFQFSAKSLHWKVPLQLLLPCPGASPLVGMRTIRVDFSPLLTEKLEQIAAHMGVTLNSVLLGTLATHLRRRSHCDQFAINLTYVGRRPDQLCMVGSYSGGVAMEFRFDDVSSSLLTTCRHVFTETMKNLEAPDKAVVNARLFSNVGYELNDLRPLRRPSSSLPPPDLPYVLCDLFFMVNEYVDGSNAMVIYDMGKIEHTYAESQLLEWLLLLEELEGPEITAND